MKLFISHATEDKADFVLPLAEKLAEAKIDVWYDDFVLKMGDSLLQEISKGLRECDYGVVVLSPAFFSKQWPQRELNGLFALESEARKIILPVWKDVGVDEVRNFSPILADRIAARAGAGLDAVIAQIKQAIGIAETVASFDHLKAAKLQLAALSKQSAERKAAERLASSSEGVKLMYDAGVAVCELIKAAFVEFQGSISEYKFQVVETRPDSITVHAAKHQLSLSVSCGITYRDAGNDFRLEALLYKRRDWPRGHQIDEEFSRLERHAWFTTDGTVLWHKDKENGVTSEQLAGMIVSSFVDKFAEFDRRGS